MEPQPRHKIRTLLTLSPSKKPEPWNVLPSGDLSFRKSSFFVFATATRNEAVAARPFGIRLFRLRFKYFECRGCPEPSPFGLFLFGRSSRSVFAKINPLQPKGGPAPLSFIYFEFKFNIWKTCVPNAAQQQNFFSPAGVFSDQLRTFGKPRPRRAWFSPPAPTATPRTPPATAPLGLQHAPTKAANNR